MLTSVITKMICDTFEGIRDIPLSDPTKAMEFSFSLNPDYDKEDGYRKLIVRLYTRGGSNYVSVLAKLAWEVIDKKYLGCGESFGDFTHDYVKGETPWKLYSEHDTGWRDSIDSIVYGFNDRISYLDAIGNWYTIKSLTPDEVDYFGTFSYRLRNNMIAPINKLEDLEFKF
jgi:hypothetical protein